jgi:hypothetical protein
MPMLWEHSSFNQDWRTLAADVEERFFDGQAHVPEHLFHYTSLAGLKGIVENGAVWATHAAFLNDLSELAYAQSLFDQIAEHLHGAASSIGKLLLERARRAIDPFDGLATFYVACFCKADDLLSQWRGYASQGGGYALGFSSRGLIEGYPHDATPLLRKVVYDRAVQETHIEELLRGAIGILDAHEDDLAGEEDRTRAVAEAIGFVRGHLWECYAAFKDAAFREEDEWRLVLAVPPGHQTNVRFRPGRSVLIPYRELSIKAKAGVNMGRLPLERVIVGPTISSTIAESSLRMFLKSHGYEHTEIGRSSVPLRWI